MFLTTAPTTLHYHYQILQKDQIRTIECRYNSGKWSSTMYVVEEAFPPRRLVLPTATLNKFGDAQGVA